MEFENECCEPILSPEKGLKISSIVPICLQMTPLTDTPWKTPLHAKYRFTTSIFLVVGNFWLINCKKTSVVKKHQRESIFLRNYTILLTAICWCFNVPTSWLPISFYFLPKVIRCPRPHPHPCTDTVKDDWDELMLHCNFVKPYWIPAKLNFQSVKFIIEMVNAEDIALLVPVKEV